MTQAPDTMLTIDPPIGTWRVGDTVAKAHPMRTELAPLLDTLGLHNTPFDPARPIIATGHQAWLWHPGILAKDFSMSVACGRLGAQPIHLVVDHIANAALTVEVPVRRGDALGVASLRLGDEDLSVATGRRPPLRAADLREATARFMDEVDGEVLADLSVLLDCPAGFDQLGSQADSITAMQLHAVRAQCPGVFVLRTSELARLPQFAALADRMLHDARRCVAAYNDAVARVPGAGVAPLLVERDRVELPLWGVDLGGGLGSVFADLADSAPLLTREDGTPIDPVTTEGGTHLPLAPKALTLTAFMRSTLCDLFIHGTGGGVYEQVTERWWDMWLGGTADSAVGGNDGRDARPTDARPVGLAPLAVVSADVTLDFEAPVATPQALDRAVWFRHHLPHNIDRWVADAEQLDPALVAEKRALLEGDPSDYPKPARLAARRRLRAINSAFVEQQPALVTDAADTVDQARQGVANADIAARRDWCFAFYPAEKLAELRESIADSSTITP